MAKCPVCNAKKGKRVCLLHETPICTTCCGDIRQRDTCAACGYYRDETCFRKYHELPAFTPSEMDGSRLLQRWSDTVESAFVAWDHLHGKVDDAVALAALERLFDKFHYGDSTCPPPHTLSAILMEIADDIMQNNKDNPVAPDMFLKALGAIYQSVRRRTRSGREYMNFIHEHVGASRCGHYYDRIAHIAHPPGQSVS
jgi:hypothetical protein